MKVPFLVFAVLLAARLPGATAGEAKSPPPFQSAAVEWCPANALALAEAAGFAYDKNAGAEVLGRLECERYESLTFTVPLPPKFKFEEGEPGPQGFITGGPRHIVIAFRGTELNVVDLLTDAWAQPVPLSSKVAGKAHGGFVRTFHGLWPDLKIKLESMRTAWPDAKIWITGHSLGGGLAVMAAATLTLEENIPVQGLITFGAPVTGDVDFQGALTTVLGGRYWRCIHELDMVTLDVNALHIPSRMPSFVTAFQHGGKSIYLAKDGTVSTSGRSAVAGELLRTGLNWASRRRFTPPADPLSRHSIGGGYIPALRKLAVSSGKTETK
ncbi:MAG TPA: lipase family protein [Verrucomicrobiales bacterium]|nr:lipase family protein [Verrucomicrobiales bacterium]